MNFSKSPLINCLSNSIQDLIINSVSSSVVHVTNITTKLSYVFSRREWAIGCDTFGIIHQVYVSKDFYIPFTLIDSIVEKAKVFGAVRLPINASICKESSMSISLTLLNEVAFFSFGATS